MPNFDYSPVEPLPSLALKYIKASLANAFVSKEIVTAIEIDWHGRNEIKKQSWDSYWDIKESLPEQDSFLHFEKTRNVYFDSGFQLDHLSAYCYRYFILLSKWLNHRNDPCVLELLSKLLSLENFAIRWHGDKRGIAAGTTSHRNPGYLLARLGKKTFNDDPKYLPIIMLRSSSGNKLFYHYRQYRISNDPDFSVFMYPATSLDDRGESFSLIESLASGFSRKPDPRSKPRAQLLAESAIYPFLKSLLGKNSGKKCDICIADLGGGSGVMLRHIWEHILNMDGSAKEKWYLNASIIGLRVQNPARHFSKGSIRANMSYLDYQQMDYLDWVNKQSETLQLDTVLMCRLLNNLSLFNIETIDDEGMLWYISGQQNSPEIVIDQKYNPIYCLNPENYCPENLIHTNGKTRLSADRSAYRVTSLTDYYKAIAACIGMDVTNEVYCYPVRIFNRYSLLDSEGKSIIEELSKIAKLTVIEDIDLTANYLAKHVQDHNLSCVISAINTDSRYSSQVLAVCDRKYEDILPGIKIC
ncbi:MAG: hypothetical protein KAS23_02510 [Anaerohalosphaera sp.]|nr:hypothetical protein [Anaerohalosphaera sp.]